MSEVREHIVFDFKVVVWGLGTNGKNLIDIIGRENIVAIIESNDLKRKQGHYMNIPLIDLKTYLCKYREYYIIITPMKYHSIEETLYHHNIVRYFVLNKSAVSLMVLSHIFDDTFDALYELEKKKTYYITKINFFNVCLYQYMQKKGYRVFFLVSEIKQSILAERVKVDGIVRHFADEIEDNQSVIIAEKQSDWLQQNVMDYAFFNQMAFKVYEEKILSFKDMHKGKRIFIVATGPSLKVEQVNKIYQNNEISISMNRIYHIFDKTKWRPTYYVASDGQAIRTYEATQMDKPDFADTEKFFSDNYVRFWNNDLDDSYHCFRQIQDMTHIGFTSDFSKEVYSGSSVVHACIQLAVYMGASEIYLLGCDFSFSNNFSSQNDHFYGNIKDGVTYTFDYDTVGKAYQVAKEYTEKQGIKIWNATQESKLEVFEKVSFEELFSDEK